MTLFEVLLSVLAVGLSGGAIAYTLYAVRSNRFERPTDAQIQHMLDTAPPETEAEAEAEDKKLRR